MMKYVIAGFALVVFVTGGIVFWQDSSPRVVLESPEVTYSPPPSVTPKATPTPTPTPKSTGSSVLLTVPFTPQAPTGRWEDYRQQNGCEEASAVMAMHWVRGTNINSLIQAETEILAVADYEEAQYGSSLDTNTTDTVRRIFNGYFNYQGARVSTDVTIAAIKAELAAGHLVLVPADGQILANPHFTQPGPLQHMLVIRGFDEKTNEFITNDPGTRYGDGYRYPQTRVLAAVYDYPTGEHEPVVTHTKSMIVVKRLSSGGL